MAPETDALPPHTRADGLPSGVQISQWRVGVFRLGDATAVVRQGQPVPCAVHITPITVLISLPG